MTPAPGARMRLALACATAAWLIPGLVLWSSVHSLHARYPSLVHCSITGWGRRGPFAELPGWEGAVAAMSGRMMAFERQLRRGGPVFTAVPVASHIAAHGALHSPHEALENTAELGLGGVLPVFEDGSWANGQPASAPEPTPDPVPGAMS